MAILDALVNIGATAMGNAAPWLAIHSADPGSGGTNPASSARIAATWPAPSTGDLTITNKVFAGGGANNPATYVGLWSAETGGTFYGSAALAGDLTFNSAGEYTITNLVINGSST